MGERTLNFGTDATDADYQVRDSDSAGGDLIIEHLPTGATFEYDATENAWIPTDPIGTANRKASAITTTSLNTDTASIGEATQIDITELLFFSYPVGRLQTTPNGGTITLPGSSAGVHKLKVRQPGNASSTDSTRVFDTTTEWDPAEPARILLDVSNITIDNDSSAHMRLQLTDVPDGEGASGDDYLDTLIRGNGDVFAATSENGTSSSTTITSQDNAYVSGLETIEFAWDGSTLTVTTDDGSTTVVVSDSSNYPSGENVHLKIEARDSSASSGNNVDFNVGGIRVER